ncbi:MAG: glycosyltransferase family 39 protein [Patescibacteria group bacterium]|jgi:4-amino-4-deoxy-L-arabinose transferase-like glycosyltransferase
MFLIKNKTGLLILLLLLGAVFRFYNLSYADSYTDESILGFRAIGLIDYNAAYTQTTPWQWFDEVPAWARLSFHDHPPVFFWLQHLSINIFGQNTFALRLPSVLAGLASLYLVFLLARRLISEKAAYLALVFLTVQSHHVWISRIGLQDSVVVFFMLLIIYLWLLALERQKIYWWLLWGLSLGLGIMTKYTTLIIIPILLVHTVIFRFSFYRQKNFWLAMILALILTLPIILYNCFLFGAVGHFDFQISALLGQDTSHWAERLGREKVGDLKDRLVGFFVVFYRSNTWLFNILVPLAWLVNTFLYFKNKQKNLLFLIVVPILLWLWFLVIGSTDRFVVMIVPWLVILLANLFAVLLETTHYRKILYLFLVLFIIWEGIFATNSFLSTKQIARASWTYSQLIDSNKNFGFNELDGYLDNIFAGKYPMATGEPRYDFLTELKDKSITDKQKLGFKPWSVIIVYDHRLFSAATLWTLQRRLIHDGWIIMPDTTFVSITGDQLAGYYQKKGVDDFIYIESLNSNQYPLDPAADNFSDDLASTKIINSYLTGKNIAPKIIENRRGEPAFAVYNF